VRAFNIDILVLPNHSTAHAICFPSDGPVEVANVLPTVGSDHRQMVTFLGPREAWIKARKRYRSLFSIDGVAAYLYLAACKGLRHPLFAKIRVDTAACMRAILAAEQAAIEGGAIMTADQEIAAMSAHVGNADEEEAFLPDSETNVQPYLVHDAVLPRPSLIRSGDNAGIQALCEILTATEQTYTEPAIVHFDPAAVSRGLDPPPEWDQNHTLLSSVFAHIFLLGKGLPTGSLTKPHLRHLFRFYGGRLEDPLFVSTAFNQLQRHACVCQTARIGATRARQLESPGTLAGSTTFRARLIWSRDNPLSDKPKSLNAKVCRILSMVDSTIAYSPFELAATRPKLAAMR
jgi:hypothetical protein